LKRPERPGTQEGFDGLDRHGVNNNSSPLRMKTSLSKPDFG
jgi:hypothetical protein